MKPHERMHHLFRNLIRKLLILVGQDFLRADEFEPYFYTYVMYCLDVFFIIICVYTIAQYDVRTTLDVIPLLGINAEVKYKGFFLNSKSMLNLTEFSFGVHFIK